MCEYILNNRPIAIDLFAGAGGLSLELEQAGCHYVIPVQAKGGNDQLSVVQTKQDILCCTEKYPNLITRAISTQFMEDDLIAIFELTVQEGQVKLIQEQHYRLVSSAEITPADLSLYRSASSKSI